MFNELQNNSKKKLIFLKKLIKYKVGKKLKKFFFKIVRKLFKNK